MKRGRKVEYAIYRKGSDELVVMGPPAICAKKLGVSISGLYSIVSRLVCQGLQKRGLPVETQKYLGKTGPLAQSNKKDGQ